MASDHLLSICQAEGETGGDLVPTLGELTICYEDKPTYSKEKSNWTNKSFYSKVTREERPGSLARVFTLTL